MHRKKMGNNSKTQILDRLRSANVSGSLYKDVEKPAAGNPFNVPVSDFISVFKRELEGISGKCFIASGESEMQTFLKQLLAEKKVSKLYTTSLLAERLSFLDTVQISTEEPELDENPVAISTCECLSARTGSVFVSAQTSEGRKMHSFAEMHIILAHESQLVQDHPEAIAMVRAKYPQGLPSAVTMITGQSRTSDIEKTLILGAHGPKEFLVIIIKA